MTRCDWLAIIEKDGTKIYQTEDRQYKVKEQLLNTMFDTIHGFKEVVVSSSHTDPYGDPRIDALTLLLTTFTLSEDECLSLISLRDKMIKEEATASSTSDRNKQIFNINIKILAKCMANFDNYFGIKKRQEIMRIASPELENTKAEYGDDEYLGMMFSQSFDEGESSND